MNTGTCNTIPGSLDISTKKIAGRDSLGKKALIEDFVCLLDPFFVKKITEAKCDTWEKK